MIDQHCGSLALAGLSPRTINARRYVLRKIETEAGPLLTLSGPMLAAWLGNRPLAPTSRHNYVTHLRGFYIWAEDQGLIEENPTATLPRIKVPRGRPRPMAETDLDRAVKRARGDVRAWILLGALAGLRCMEIARIRGEDVDVDNAVLYIRGKGGSVNVVPAHPAILSLAGSYPASGWWFESRMRPGEPVTAAWVSRHLSDFLESIGVRATAHQLRHLAATRWYRSSGDILLTSTLMRHASVASTMTYAAVANDRGAAVVCAQPVPMDAA